MPAENITLYAKWMALEDYTVSFVSNGGSEETLLIVQEGSVLNLPTPEKIGNTFIGWYINPGFSKLFTGEIMPGYDIVLFAKWQVNKYTISFETGEGNALNPINIDYDSKISLPIPENGRHSFLGWYTDDNFNSPFTLETMPDNDMILYAKWGLEQLILTFISYGEIVFNNFSIDFGSNVQLPELELTGYEFLGWCIENQSQTILTDTSMLTTDTVLHAQWIPIKLTVSFDSNGGEDIESVLVDYGTTLSLPVPIKEGNTFLGWFTSEDEIFTDVEIVDIEMTLLAKWQVNQYTVSFNSNEGTPISDESFYFGESTTKIANLQPTKVGHMFVGWYTDPELLNVYVATQISAFNFTLYAKWEVKQYRIYLISNDVIIENFLLDYGKFLNISNPTRADYTFVGWYTDSLLTKSLDITTMPASDLTLYAKWVYNESAGLQYQLINNDTEYAVSGYTGSDVVVKIPAYHNDKLVTAIEGIGFGNNNTITSVIFEEGSQLYQIGSYTFYNSSVNSIILPDTVRIISYCAFYNATKLTSIEIPVGVTEIESMTFYGASSLSNITLPEGLKDIKTSAFQGTNLSNITIPNSVTHIGSAAFSDVSSLISVTLPSGLTTIESSTFFYTTNLSSITIPYGVTSIGARAFYWSGIRSISIPSSVTSIGDFAFCGATSLLNITIPDSVTSIGQSAFYSTGLTSVTLSKGLTEIPNYCFDNTKSLMSIVIPNNITRIGNGAFNNASSLATITISSNLTTIGDYAFSGTTINSFDLPATVTTIGDRVFNAIDGLVIITLRSTTPPSLAGYLGMGNGGVYVPSGSVNAYKSAPNWSYYSAKIASIPA